MLKVRDGSWQLVARGDLDRATSHSRASREEREPRQDDASRNQQSNCIARVLPYIASADASNQRPEANGAVPIAVRRSLLLLRDEVRKIAPLNAIRQGREHSKKQKPDDQDLDCGSGRERTEIP